LAQCWVIHRQLLLLWLCEQQSISQQNRSRKKLRNSRGGNNHNCCCRSLFVSRFAAKWMGVINDDKESYDYDYSAPPRTRCWTWWFMWTISWEPFNNSVKRVQ
jgi:hypothetical protein